MTGGPAILATQAQLASIAAGFSGSAEYAALYAGQSNEQIINSLYMNLFGRNAEPAGLTSWAGTLTSGTQTFAAIALQLTYSAQGTDATAIANKLAASTTFTAALDTPAEISGYSGTAAAASVRTWLANVTDVASTLTAATASVSTAVNSAIAASAAETGAGTTAISAAGEIDSVPYTMVAGHSYRIEVQAAAGSLLNPEITGILDPSQNAITGATNADYGVSQNAQLTFMPTADGVYNINIQGQNGTIGEYVVLITDLSTASVSNNTQTTITAGQAYSDTVGLSFETRTVFFDLTSDQEYQFSLQSATSGNGLSSPVLQGIYDGSGKPLPGSYGQATGGTLTLHITPTGSGAHYAVIADAYDDTGSFNFAFNAAATAKGGAGAGRVPVPPAPMQAVSSYPVQNVAPETMQAATKVAARTTDVISATTSTNASIVPNSSVTGAIDTAGDVDWYSAAMTAGVTYTVHLQGLGSGGGTLIDTVISGIYDSAGNYIANTYNDDNGFSLDSQVSFTPAASGAYYIAAGAFGSYTGTYTLSVSAESDSVAGNSTTTATVAAGSSIAGSIDSATDADWYAISLTAGYMYTVQLQGSSFGNGTLTDPLISGIYDSSGTYIFNTYADDQSGTDSSISFAPSATGTYYIAAEGYGSYTGTFLLSVQQAAAEVAGSASTTASLAVGGSASVTIDQAYDHDWYAVSLTGGNTYQFTLSGTGAAAYPTIYGIYDAAGNYIEGYTPGVTSGSTTVATTTFTPTATGTYYVDAYSYYSGSYTLGATQQITADIAANTGTGGSVGAAGSVTGTIGNAADADWYAVNLTAGNSYTILLQGSYSGNGTLSDPLISGVYNSSGVYVSNTYADDQDGTDSSLAFTPAASGTYYIAAEGYGNATGTFMLSVSPAASDIAASAATTGVVSVGSYVNGTIGSTADADWYAVNLAAGSTYTIRLQGSASGNGTLSDPLISGLYNANGILVPDTYADDQDGSDSRLDFAPTASGTYYIAAEGNGSASGTFRLSVEQQVSAELAADITTTGAVLANSSVAGVIDTAGDQDWFAVRLNADTRYQIDLQGLSTNSGTLADPRLYGLYDSSGTLIAGTADDDSGQGYNSRIALDITSAGTYYVAAGAYGSNTGTYTLAVTSQGGLDIPANTATTATVAPGGSVDGLIGQAGDRDWFAITLTAGQSCTIDLQPKTNSTAPLLDPYIYGIYNSAGTLISGTGDDDSGAGYGAQVAYTATASGAYYIAAGGYGGHTGNYVLSVSNGTTGNSAAAADLAADTATAGIVSAGASATGRIDFAGDQDWFRVNLSAGRSYDIGLGGSASNSGSLTDPYLRGIYDSAGTLIAGTIDDNNGYGNNALVSFTPAATDVYYISAGAFASATGSYTLTVSENTAANTGNNAPVASGTQGSWTIMVYVDGDNNLESFALTDVNEMEAARLPQNMQISALIDRMPGYSSADGNWTDTRFGLIGGDNNLNHISSSLTSWGERNMGSPATLTEFINASAQAAPADNYALVVWDHGGGIAGAAWDDTSYGANLSLNEVSQAIAASNVTHFGMIGFDACLQGLLDQAYVLRTQTDYLVASQDIEPGDGWDYTNWLSAFQQSAPSGLQLATQAVNSYESFYQAQGNNQVTLSVIDTSQVGGVATAWTSFAQSVNAAGSGAMLTLHSARSSSLDFYNNTYVDLQSLMSNFMQLNAVASLDTSAQNVLSALSNAVLETGGLATASGLTVYLPETANSGYLNAGEYAVAGLTGISNFYTAYWA